MNAKARVKIIVLAALLSCAGLNGDVFAQVVANPPVSSSPGGVTVTASGPLVTVGIGVQVPVTLSLSYWIRWVNGHSTDPWASGLSGDAASLDFGMLTKPTADNYYVCMADRYFAVFLLGSAGGLPYTIQQTCLGISNGAGNLNYSLVMKPDFQPGDRYAPTDPPQWSGPLPAGDSLGNKGAASLAVFGNTTAGKGIGGVPGTPQTIISSGNGIPWIVRCYYGIATGNTDSSKGAVDPDNAEPITSDNLAGTYTGIITFTLTSP